ncbi:MAG: hypothetical protein U0599_21750 [Vicinamibacteria bacterium]
MIRWILGVSGPAQLLAREREEPGEHLVEEDAEGADVRARVDVEAAHLGLLGLMYSGVPTRIPISVNSSLASCCDVAFATPKSMIFGTGVLVADRDEDVFDGLRSRWMIPFWCAC